MSIEIGGVNLVDISFRGIHALMKAVWLVWVLFFAASLISFLNLKVPKGQEYIFRKTETAQVQK